MPVTPRGYLYGPPLSAAVEGQAAYEGALGGLANLGQTIMQAQQLGPAGDAAYLARTVGGQKLGEAAGKLTGGLTYGGGDALRQIFAGLPAGGAGGKGGRGALQMALDPQPIHVVQDEASRLHELAVAFQDAERRRALDMTPLGRAVAPQAATEGLRNVPAERLGLDPRLVVRPDTISQLADLVGRKDPSARSMLIAEGLDPNMTAEDLAGLAAKSRLYASELASRSGRKQKERAAIDLSGRTLLMKSRLTQMGYDADNIDMVAAELAKLGDDAARFALDELGRPTKFGHELALAKRRSVKTIIQKHIVVGGKKGTGGGGGGGGRSASEIGKDLRDVRASRAAIENKVEPGVGYTTDQQKTLDELRIRQKRLEAEWDEVYLGESQGPAGKALTADEEAAALWRSGADYHQALTRMKERHPDVNHVGLLFNYGKRDAWNKARDTAPAPVAGAASDFSVWVRGLSDADRQKTDADLDRAARAVIASGGSEDQFVSSVKQPGSVFSLPHGESYLRMAFVAAKNSPAGSTPSQAVDPTPRKAEPVEAGAAAGGATQQGAGRTVQLDMKRIGKEGLLEGGGMVYPTPLPASTTEYIKTSGTSFDGWDTTDGLVQAAALREMASTLKPHDIAGFERVLQLAEGIDPGYATHQKRETDSLGYGRQVTVPGTATSEEIALTYKLMGDALDEAARRTHGKVSRDTVIEGRYPKAVKKRSMSYYIPDVGARYKGDGRKSGPQEYREFTEFKVDRRLKERIEQHRGAFDGTGGDYYRSPPGKNSAPPLTKLQDRFQTLGDWGVGDITAKVGDLG